MAPQHIMRDVESSLPATLTLPAYRAQRAAEAPAKGFDKFKRGLYSGARRYCAPSNVRSHHHA